MLHAPKAQGPSINLFLPQVVIHFTDGADDSMDQLSAASVDLHKQGRFLLFKELVIASVNVSCILQLFLMHQPHFDSNE